MLDLPLFDVGTRIGVTKSVKLTFAAACSSSSNSSSNNISSSSRSSSSGCSENC